ncbi:hypothetical protein HK099_007917 [Clydaea vesicula]|uniref:Glutamate/phenylalanine/leucine/valine/L-tryptophan dehydrogenase C-terminal domain-containing protein n=1 Tax=Clydaea vesicula TaxID=447962 RepID=A0AAD5TWM3_9FUNG|nr:hypothetical protein HK099_007917 [Clydaea vesicula]
MVMKVFLCKLERTVILYNLLLFIGPIGINKKNKIKLNLCYRGPGAGGVRNWVYDNMLNFFEDGLRLSKGMTHKNALAGIWWGGAKGVMARNSGKGLQTFDSKEERKTVYAEYGDLMTSLKGCYHTAEDVGTNTEDMRNVFSRTRFTTCIPADVGGSGNPSVPTALGVSIGIEAAFNYLNRKLVDATIAVQGTGHVGKPLIKFLFSKGVKKIIATDIDEHRKEDILKEFKDFNFELRIVKKDDNSILFEDVDCVAPCATGGTLNSETIPKIKAKIVCGAANNQLLNFSTDDVLLKKRNILYVPGNGTLRNDPNIEKHLGRTWENSIYLLCLKVFKESENNDKETTNTISLKIADKKSFEVNPIYGHRGKVIIDALRKESTSVLEGTSAKL